MDKRLPETDTIEALLDETVPTLEVKSGTGDYYLPASHIQLLEQMEHLSRYSHFIQIITGVSGSGKTILLQQFYPNADDSSVYACCIQALPEMNAAALLAELAQQLNLDTDQFSSASSQLQALVDHAELLQQLSRQMLIVIDDAEHLALDALELLFNQLSTLTDDDTRPHIVLFATPRIRQTIAAPSLCEAVETSGHFIEIPTLDRAALDGLLAQCFSAVAARLDDAQKQRVHTDSLGLPGRVARALEATTTNRQLVGTPATKATKRPSKPLFLGVAAAVVMVMLGAGLWLALPALLLPTNPSPLVAENSNRVRLKLSIEPKPEPARVAANAAAPLQTNSFEQRLAQARAALEADQPRQQEPPSTPPPSMPAPSEDGSSVSGSDAVQTTAPAQLLELAPVTAPLVAAPNPLQTTPSTQAQPPSATLVLKLPSAADREIEQQPLTEPVRIEAPTPSVTYFGDGQTLLGWNPQGYTLQMLGARRQESVVEFIASMPEPSNLLYFSTIYKEKPWYVVVYGSFSDRDAAMTAMGELPSPLRSRRPWARSIKGVQDDIQRGDL